MYFSSRGSNIEFISALLENPPPPPTPGELVAAIHHQKLNILPSASQPSACSGCLVRFVRADAKTFSWVKKISIAAHTEQCIARRGAFLMSPSKYIYIYIHAHIAQHFAILGVVLGWGVRRRIMATCNSLISEVSW